MRYLFLMLLLLSGKLLCGQSISGLVIDQNSKQPLYGAIINYGRLSARTNRLGKFEITSVDSDTLKVSCFGYKSYTALRPPSFEITTIELEPAVITLKEVPIRANRRSDAKRDSLNNRIDFARQFNYTGPKVMDAFSSGLKQPGELLSINLLVLVQALTKKSTPQYKFKQVLLRDEKAEYVDQKFNRGIVSRMTGLKGDRLSVFLANYRPTYLFAQKATDYDMEVYIKNCLKQFENDGIKGTDAFAAKN